MKWHLLLSLSLLTVVLCTGCGDADDHDHEDHEELSAEEEACTHAQDSPTTVAASAGLAGLDADVSQRHTLYEVTLQETETGSGDYRGYLSYEAAEHADYLIFTSTEVELRVLDTNDVAQDVSVEAVDGCAELAQSHRVSLEAQSYVIELGPSDASTLSLIIEPEAHDHDHD
ncbi:hypothetical protein FRC98_01090 [Lujinxingia vulgaris]|uniref:Lipoprotein n=1 Tax=Lujinxingia vulgaris TaxID=2600176 RepID=A0A5C6XHN8_9DELT|nr:hypothetical protein [Lujinxingia vulgaris]TXD39028.1 hypothetical protein FRC98_01090 [Lujinxingia vulgaris]